MSSAFTQVTSLRTVECSGKSASFDFTVHRGTERHSWQTTNCEQLQRTRLLKRMAMRRVNSDPEDLSEGGLEMRLTRQPMNLDREKLWLEKLLLASLQQLG